MNIWDAFHEAGWTVNGAPDKVLKRMIPDWRGKAKWEIIVNGNKEPRNVEADQWGEVEVPPFTIAVFWNGWLAGLIDPNGGAIAAHHEGANEENLVRSILASNFQPGDAYLSAEGSKNKP